MPPRLPSSCRATWRKGHKHGKEVRDYLGFTDERHRGSLS